MTTSEFNLFAKYPHLQLYNDFSVDYRAPISFHLAYAIFKSGHSKLSRCSYYLCGNKSPENLYFNCYSARTDFVTGENNESMLWNILKHFGLFGGGGESQEKNFAQASLHKLSKLKHGECMIIKSRYNNNHYLRVNSYYDLGESNFINSLIVFFNTLVEDFGIQERKMI